MKVTILGSGNAFNSSGRGHATYLLDDGAEGLLLLDAGATALYRLQQEQVDLLNIHTILLTHFHGDHYGGLPFIWIELSMIRGRTEPLTILGPAGVEAACRRLMECMYPGLQLRFELVFREVKSQGERDGAFHVKPFAISHKAESTGYRIWLEGGRSFAFSGDSAFDEKLFALMDGVDTAVIELSTVLQVVPPSSHVALEEVRAGRYRIRARRVIWTHIYDKLAAMVRKEGLGETAHDGMVLEV